MLRWLFALVAIAFSPPALAAELEFLRGSTVPAYTVPQMAPQLPDAAPLSAPLGTARPFVLVQPIAPPPPLVWNWTGFYIGANAGLAFASTNFADPFGASVFGDTVRSPGSMAGGQIGFNWQAPGWQWVFGVEADGDAISSDGTSTCFAASALTINATCRVRPQSVATLTGRIGYAMSPTDELHNIAPIGILPFRSATLIYGKAGVARAGDQIDMATNNDLAGFAEPAIASNSTNTTFWGWTVGFGIEQALSAAWSLKVEYDYLGFPSRNIANLGSATVDPSAVPLSSAPPGSSGVSQSIQLIKMGVNYKWGANPLQWGDAVPVASGVNNPPPRNWLAGWDAEGGVRYFGSWGRFQKDIGNFANSGVPGLSAVSRLTYADMQTNSGELFARIDSPWRFFVKGFVGTGATNGGPMNDEDFGIPLLGTYAAYSNTLSTVTGNINYGAVDAGVNLLDAPGYKVGAFAGYFYLNQDMSAFGCQPLANINCIPNVPSTGSAIITESDRWQALRVGVAGETRLINRLALSADVAYLPLVNFSGVDNHFFGNTGQIASVNPETANKGAGVQLEAMISYYITSQFNVGLGGRYWALWTTDGQIIRTVDNGVPITATPPQIFRGAAEQVGVFLQAAYRFGPICF
ncbi:MAG: outer membrane beta-barrel protein [Xanthobacteraceae bacterium]